MGAQLLAPNRHFCPLHAGGWLFSAMALEKFRNALKSCKWNLLATDSGFLKPGDIIGECAQDAGLDCVDFWKVD